MAFALDAAAVRCLSIAAAAVLLAGIQAPAAWAGKIRLVETNLVYVAAPGEVNHVSYSERVTTVQPRATTIQIRDSAGIVLGDDYCTRVDTRTVTCRGEGASDHCMPIDLGDRNDTFVAAPKPALGIACFEVLDGPGNDRVTGHDLSVTNGPGQDVFRGVTHMDRTTGAGNDVVYGTPTDDTLLGGTGNDRLYGLAGNDRITGGLGLDSMFGGPGLDFLDGRPGDIRRG